MFLTNKAVSIKFTGYLIDKKTCKFVTQCYWINENVQIDFTMLLI